MPPPPRTQLPAGTPAWQRAQDIKAYINSRPQERDNPLFGVNPAMRSVLLILCGGLIAVGAFLGVPRHHAEPTGGRGSRGCR